MQIMEIYEIKPIFAGTGMRTLVGRKYSILTYPMIISRLPVGLRASDERSC